MPSVRHGCIIVVFIQANESKKVTFRTFVMLVNDHIVVGAIADFNLCLFKAISYARAEAVFFIASF